MDTDKQTLMSLVFLQRNGELSEKDLHTLIQVGTGKKSLLQETGTMECLDMDGNPLIKGERYLFNNNIVKIVKEVYGQSNIMDTYYRVVFLNHELEEDFRIIKGWGNPFAGFTYRTQFKLIS